MDNKTLQTLALFAMQNRSLVADSIVDLIGNTPMVRLNKLVKEHECHAEIVLKLESMQPSSSVKDRIAQSMIEKAEERGEIHPGITTLVEPTSGNTGIGLAMVGAAKGYSVIIVMTDTASMERRICVKALGAKLVLTSSEYGVKGCIAKAKEIVKRLGDNAKMLMQFENMDNPETHYLTTGPEIWYQMNHNIDAFVAGVGTGGTLSGTAKYLKEQNNSIKIYAVEPEESAVLSGQEKGKHKIQGIGPGFIAPTCDTSIIDEVITVQSDDAIYTARNLATSDGIFVGVSSGAAVKAALIIGKRSEMKGKRIAVIIPSFGERYLSTDLFSDIAIEAKNQEIEIVDMSIA